MTKVVSWVLLLAAGVLSLPLSAALFDAPGTENWIVPVQLGVMALLGGLAGVTVPRFVTGTTSRRLAVGAACGVAAGVAGILLFFLLLNGFGGA